MPPLSSIRAYLLMLAFVAGACGESTVPPTTPAVVPTTAPASQIFTQITGYVSDTAARPLPDVRVEIVDQSQTVVASTLSDAGGRVAFSGSFAGPVTGRATKDGYMTASQGVHEQNSLPPSPSTGYVYFSLESLAAPVKIETGAYTLTVTADSACTDLPDNVRTRTYAATVASSVYSNIPESYFVSVAGTTTWCCLGPGGFGIGVSGNYVAVTTDDTGGQIIEETPVGSLQIDPSGGTSVQAPAVSTLSFGGNLNYCPLKSDTGKIACSDCRIRTILTR